MLAGLLALVGISYAIEAIFSVDTPIEVRPISALVIALAPALLWLASFHLRELREAAPKGHVVPTFLFGAFVAGPSAAFIIDLSAHSFEPALNFSSMALERWIYAIAIAGMAQELAVYLVVRYSLYTSPAFDEPIDGLVYMSAAGIGFASYESYQLLQATGGEIFLSAAVSQSAITTLGHASFAGIMGLAMAHAKFSFARHVHRSTALVVGLLAAAILNGTYHAIMDSLSAQDLNSSLWKRASFGFGFAAGAFLLTAILVRGLLESPPPAQKAADE